jgi:siroheme synthase-like protein
VKAEALGLPVTLDVEGAAVLVVGDNEEALRKEALLAEAGAQVLRAASFEVAQLDGKRLAFLCPVDPALAARMHAEAKSRGVLFWACDVPEHSDFAMPAIARAGAARLAISTSGRSPALAARLREALEAGLGESFARFVEALGQARLEVRDQEPSFEKRRDKMRALLDGLVIELRVRYPGWFRP